MQSVFQDQKSGMRLLTVTPAALKSCRIWAAFCVYSHWWNHF